MTKIVETLKKEREHGFMFEGEDPVEVIDRILPYIGAPDPFLRDALVYGALATLTRRESLKVEHNRKLLKQYLSPKYLFHGLDSGNVEAALTRSFTLLQLCVLLDVEKECLVFRQEDLDMLLNSLLDYYTREPILTGYHPAYGWVHTMAHSADLFEGFFALIAFTDEQMQKALDAIRGWFIDGGHAYTHGEDLRTAKAVFTGIRSGAIA